MNKFYVTKEVAEKLRAKGYNVEELHYENSCLCIDEVYQTDNLRIYKFPRIDEVFAWLREEKKIYLELVIAADAEYMCDIYNIDARPIKCLGSTEYYKTYEAAAIAGITWVLDNLI